MDDCISADAKKFFRSYNWDIQSILSQRELLDSTTWNTAILSEQNIVCVYRILYLKARVIYILHKKGDTYHAQTLLYSNQIYYDILSLFLDIMNRCETCLTLLTLDSYIEMSVKDYFYRKDKDTKEYTREDRVLEKLFNIQLVKQEKLEIYKYLDSIEDGTQTYVYENVKEYHEKIQFYKKYREENEAIALENITENNKDLSYIEEKDRRNDIKSIISNLKIDFFTRLVFFNPKNLNLVPENIRHEVNEKLELMQKEEKIATEIMNGTKNGKILEDDIKDRFMALAPERRRRILKSIKNRKEMEKFIIHVVNTYYKEQKFTETYTLLLDLEYIMRNYLYGYKISNQNRDILEKYKSLTNTRYVDLYFILYVKNEIDKRINEFKLSMEKDIDNLSDYSIQKDETQFNKYLEEVVRDKYKNIDGLFDKIYINAGKKAVDKSIRFLMGEIYNEKPTSITFFENNSEIEEYKQSMIQKYLILDKKFDEELIKLSTCNQHLTDEEIKSKYVEYYIHGSNDKFQSLLDKIYNIRNKIYEEEVKPDFNTALDSNPDTLKTKSNVYVHIYRNYEKKIYSFLETQLYPIFDNIWNSSNGDFIQFLAGNFSMCILHLKNMQTPISPETQLIFIASRILKKYLSEKQCTFGHKQFSFPSLQLELLAYKNADTAHVLPSYSFLIFTPLLYSSITPDMQNRLLTNFGGDIPDILMVYLKSRGFVGCAIYEMIGRYDTSPILFGNDSLNEISIIFEGPHGILKKPLEDLNTGKKYNHRSMIKKLDKPPYYEKIDEKIISDCSKSTGNERDCNSKSHCMYKSTVCIPKSSEWTIKKGEYFVVLDKQNNPKLIELVYTSSIMTGLAAHLFYGQNGFDINNQKIYTENIIIFPWFEKSPSTGVQFFIDQKDIASIAYTGRGLLKTKYGNVFGGIYTFVKNWLEKGNIRQQINSSLPIKIYGLSLGAGLANMLTYILVSEYDIEPRRIFTIALGGYRIGDRDISNYLAHKFKGIENQFCNYIKTSLNIDNRTNTMNFEFDCLTKYPTDEEGYVTNFNPKFVTDNIVLNQTINKEVLQIYEMYPSYDVVHNSLTMTKQTTYENVGINSNSRISYIWDSDNRNFYIMDTNILKKGLQACIDYIRGTTSVPHTNKVAKNIIPYYSSMKCNNYWNIIHANTAYLLSIHDPKSMTYSQNLVNKDFIINPAKIACN